MDARLPAAERQEQILTRLHHEGTVRIVALAREFGVASETIRRDLDALSRRGLLDRTYGGAMRKSFTEEPTITERRQRRLAERRRIAAHATRLIDPGDAVMIDSGSTTTHFAQRLAESHSGLTVVTNCLPVATRIARGVDMRVVLAPGEYRARETGVYGHETLDFLKRYRVNRVVIGAGGLTPDGPTDVDSQGAWVKRAMIAQGDETILLLDSSKFGLRHFEIVCPLEQITHLVTDQSPDTELGHALDAANLRLHRAPEAPGTDDEPDA